MYLSSETGRICIEGKGVMNYAIGERRNSGIERPEAVLGLGPDLTEAGPQISPNAFIARNAYELHGGEVARYWVEAASRNRSKLTALFLSPRFGSILVLALVVMGLFRRAWDHRRALSEIVLIGVVLGHLFVLLGLHDVLPRYLMPLMPLIVIWASKGIDEVASWAVSTARRNRILWRCSTSPLHLAVRGALTVGIVVLALWGMRTGPFVTQGPYEMALKKAGIWLANHRPGPKRVMTHRPQVPYYSSGKFLPMPIAGEPEFLRYVHRKHPDFIVLTDYDERFWPWFEDWLTEGIPDPAATLVYSVGNETEGRVEVFEWNDRRAGAALGALPFEDRRTG
jgi:hypothetical protein